MSAHVLDFRSEITGDFLKKALGQKKCENCGGASPKLRKEGFQKIFQMALSSRDKKSMDAHGLKLVAGINTNANFLDGMEQTAGEEDAAGRELGSTARQAAAQAEAEEAEEEEAEEDDEDEIKQNSSARYLTSLEVEGHVKKLHGNTGRIIDMIFGAGGSRSGRGWENFFFNVVPVCPNRYRPYQVRGDEISEHPQNTYLAKIINANRALLDKISEVEDLGDDQGSTKTFAKAVVEMLELQDSVNCYIDSSKAATPPMGKTQIPAGIKQGLEKKEGLFRKHMMGKRVNFACRSVISPDNNLETNQIGVPLYFAKTLSFPEAVTTYNVKLLREAVINGPDVYPGANYIIDEDGNTIQLANRSHSQREALSRQLLNPKSDTAGKSLDKNAPVYSNKKVGRHLKDGDMMLTNRQPTLHKPGILAHEARVMRKEKTIRMHYANCNTLNADFDGDEINLHLPQSELSQAEARFIAHADLQYCVPKDGSPLRGLIQDHVIGGTLLTSLDTFFDQAQFSQHLYATFPNALASQPFWIPAPAILKPRRLWTGKQLIMAMIHFLTPGMKPLTMQAKCKVKAEMWGPHAEEGVMRMRQGYFCTGVLEKSQFGSTEFGLVHAIVDLYSPAIGGKLLGAFGRLFSYYLQTKGHTCGIDDLLITPEAEQERSDILTECREAAMQVSADLVGCKIGDKKLMPLLNKLLRDPAEEEKLDRLMMQKLNPYGRRVVDCSVPKGQYKPFPENKFALMHTSGAKGSQVNHTQISCLLGQQALEGRRVPRMVSGKTLPCFEPYDPAPMAGGFIQSRYLTGLKPSEYFFHCMAGREGLVDTAVKTSRSGYLQRCLIKHLEGLKVAYDGSVRDADGSVMQFNYGEDSINVQDSSYLKRFDFIAENAGRFEERVSEGIDLDSEEVSKAHSAYMKRRKSKWREAHDPFISKNNPQAKLGAVSEGFEDALEEYISSNEKGLLGPKEEGKVPEERFRALMWLKYQRTCAEPGEAVGLLASQSIGEPSTQMTLNTFHHTGQSEFNVTMGIPRMREVIMTASEKIKTPMMVLPLKKGLTTKDAEAVCHRFYRLRMVEVLENITVKERVEADSRGGERKRRYKIELSMKISKRHIETFHLDSTRLQTLVETQYIPKVNLLMAREAKRNGDSNRSDIIVRRAKESVSSLGEPDEEGDNTAPKKKKAKDDESDDDDDGENGEEDAELSSMRNKKKQSTSYEDEDSQKAKDEEGDDIEDDAEEDDEEMEVYRQSKKEATPKKEKKKKKEKKVGMTELQKAQADARKSKLLASSPLLHDYSHVVRDDGEGGYTLFTDVTLQMPPSQRKILVSGIAEEAAGTVLLNNLRGIKRAFVVEKQGEITVQTDGVNFEAAYNNDDVIDLDRVTCNDIVAILTTYGVEAARRMIASEVNAIFSAFGITSDSRHLGLLADYMTFLGGYRPLNRMGIATNTSPFLKMSFETTATFLEQAMISGEKDDMTSPSAAIVLGKPVSTGTGCFDVIQPLNFKRPAKKRPVKLG